MSLIECILKLGKYTKPWVIFKGKQLDLSWGGICPGAHISVSKRGWTDDELYIAWLEHLFKPETRPADYKKKGKGWRILIFDGHGSYITP